MSKWLGDHEYLQWNPGKITGSTHKVLVGSRNRSLVTELNGSLAIFDVNDECLEKKKDF